MLRYWRSSLLSVLLLIKRYNLYKVLACSTAFFHVSLFCAIFFQLCTFIFLISSKTSFSQRVLGLPISLLDMGFQLLIFWTLLSSAMCSTWPNQFNLCFLINPIIFRPFSMSLISCLLSVTHENSEIFTKLGSKPPSNVEAVDNYIHMMTVSGTMPQIMRTHKENFVK